MKGDSRCYSIAAASIIAKVSRDRLMRKYSEQWPVYGFATHKGYPTAAHMALVREHGPCDIHRFTFAPLKHWYPERAAKAKLGEEPDQSSQPEE